ncbi:MAG: diguanylate cyclase [Alphaproteobacteria bacterium]|nr:diguanylate cyclase [Alphaproteobacteria bacterium]
MSLIRHLTQEEMLAVVTELDQAIYTHEQWTEEMYTALICHVHADERDLSDDSYHRCRFGQWYYADGTAKLSDWPGFEEIAIEHKRMHQYATSLLRASMHGTPISLHDYERFVSALKRMRLEIQTLKRELEVSLYNTDALTGVPGRLQMLQKMRENQEFVVRGIHSCAIAMLDVDKFKAVNDVHGHLAGDHVLTAIAGYIQAHLRPYDLIFRYGGEEFLLCMPDANLESGREICDRLRSELGSLSHEADGGSGFQVTVSIGVAELGADYTVEEAINRADQALLSAKAAGRDRVFAWNPPLAITHLAAG